MQATVNDPMESSSSKRIKIKPWREITLVAMICMELSWLALWYRVFTQSHREVPYLQAIGVLAGMLVFVYLINRLMIFLDTRLIFRRVMLFLALVINLLVGLKLLLYSRESISLVELFNRPLRNFQDLTDVLPAEFVVMMFVLLICWRGIVYSDYQIGSVNAQYAFRLGIVMFFLYGLALPFTNESPNLALFIFLFSSMLAMTTARISVLSQLRGGQSIQFNRQWLLGITLVILGMIGVSALVVYFTREQFFSLMSLAFSWLVYVVVLLFSPLIFAFLQFFIWLFEAIRVGDIFNLIYQALKNLELMMSSLMSSVSGWLDQFNLDGFAEFFQNVTRLKALFLWGSVALVIAAILLGLRRYIFKEEQSDAEDLHTEEIDEDLFRLLRASLRRGLDRLAENLDDLLKLRRARQLLAAARIRRIYAMLLRLNARLDNPRPASRTPLEYLPQMVRLFPSLSGDLSTITEAYLLVRYGEMPESTEELDRVEGAWKRISNAGRDQLKTRRRARR
ncbi:MAG: DUF4129 domain-containing protein [Anaerolineales bacterium]